MVSAEMSGLWITEAPFAMDRLFNALQVSPLLGGDKLILLKNFKTNLKAS